jgi:hypothetical protein
MLADRSYAPLGLLHRILAAPVPDAQRRSDVLAEQVSAGAHGDCFSERQARFSHPAGSDCRGNELANVVRAVEPLAWRNFCRVAKDEGRRNNSMAAGRHDRRRTLSDVAAIVVNGLLVDPDRYRLVGRRIIVETTNVLPACKAKIFKNPERHRSVRCGQHHATSLSRAAATPE